jgi:hypothetical protein
VQVEDDITASAVVPSAWLPGVDASVHPSVKLVTNCESHLFQRPDDAKYRGYDQQAEADIAEPGTFLSNWQPLSHAEVQDMVDNIVDFDEYTEPMKKLLLDFLKEGKPSYVVSSALARMVDGKPSKNPRYLQKRPDRVNVRDTHVADISTRLARGIASDKQVYFPVSAVVAGRRNNPADLKAGIPPLAVYNPIHYQELPELFMDFISSLTGKSPSTTGFGSEGALTKGPFNALWPVVDLNNALLSYILTGYAGFTTAAGYVGPYIQVEHDISLLIPEIWSRMKPAEQQPDFLIANGYLEKCNDFEHNGKTVLASRLGYRITARFTDLFLGRVFETPNAVFTEEILQPEKQDLTMFAQGVHEIVATQQRVAENYFHDGSVDAACPPLKALLHIMARGHFENKPVTHPNIRDLFKRENVINSDWYKKRLATRQAREIALWRKHVAYIDEFSKRPGNAETVVALGLAERLKFAQDKLQQVERADYAATLTGTLGADPFEKQL